MTAVLITGGLGYVGGRLVGHLKRQRPELALRLSTHRRRVLAPAWADGCTLVEMDLLDPASLQNGLEGVDTIIHLASLNERESTDDPARAIDVNVKGSYELLRAAGRCGVRRLVYLSTFHVYGRQAGVISESTVPRPVHPYAITHLEAEHWVRHGGEQTGLATLVLRLSNGYGYPMDENISRWSLVFNDCCRQAATGGPIVLKTGGTQLRDFIALHDVARAVDHFLFGARDRWGDGLFNLGGACRLSIRDVAERVANVYERLHGGRSVRIVVPEHDSSASSPPFTYSIDRLLATGFSLEGNIDREIERTIAYCETWFRSASADRQDGVRVS